MKHWKSAKPECSEKICEELNIVAAELYKPKAKFKEEPSFVEHENKNMSR